MGFWFWTVVFGCAMVWYIVVTIIVTVRGGKDLRDMFRNMDND